MKLKRILAKNSGRSSNGRISVRHQGGRHKRFLREIDFKRDKLDIVGRVEAIEYDPNRTADVALVVYTDGERRYILAPAGLAVGQTIMASKDASLKVGNALPLSKIPVGTNIHNIELTFGKGGQIVRSAGTLATVQGKEDSMITIKLPSGEIRKIDGRCFATIGQVSRLEHKTEIIGKAGRSRHMGIRPTVRGVAMYPTAHPHGGGEGRSGEGMPPKTPWGKPARGVKTRKRHKYSDKYIIGRRRSRLS
ncbi:50S ribosomal protein L2 [Candidatus Microgenomates bacterium]|nr:50S ribosomal protein L2 [Candidatus Microgenomates bacterium]